MAPGAPARSSSTASPSASCSDRSIVSPRETPADGQEGGLEAGELLLGAMAKDRDAPVPRKQGRVIAPELGAEEAAGRGGEDGDPAFAHLRALEEPGLAVDEVGELLG